MRAALPLLAAFAAFTAGCGFGHDVGQDGKYLGVPSTPVTDSAPYPLATLLLVQRSVAFEQTRLYAFRGDLGRADLGIEDLRRIATRFGGFAMAFDLQSTRFEAGDLPKSRGNPLMAKVAGEDLALVRLNDAGLKATGATTWLSRVNTTDYDVSAYFGVIDNAEPMSLAISRAGLDYDPPADDPELAFERDDEKISLEFTSKADYVVIELVQPIVETKTMEDDEDAGIEPRILDGLVRTLLSPATKYQVGPELLTDVAGKGCWSREQPIEARLHQFFRRYQQRAKGDWAVVYERIDRLEVIVEDWTALLGDPTPSAYCKDFEAVAR